MTLRLTVDTARWREHVAHVARHAPGLIPVVKGNGYGFGRHELATVAAELSATIAVGTVHELGGLPGGVTPVVLTPSLRPPDDVRPILTVGSAAHVDALAGWPGRVVVKLCSSVRRFGVTPDELGPLAARARTAGLEIAAFAVHPPVDGPDDEHVDDIATWFDLLAPGDEVWVSHLSADGYAALHDAWPERPLRIRHGTALWHGAGKPALHLGADVLDVRRVSAGDTAGYRRSRIAESGWICVVGAGTAHGVHPLESGRSPFHFARRRLVLVEPPHMHAAMVFVPAGEEPPALGAIVDVQHPLISTHVDEVVWA
ncbi:MAG: alanine racemase [Acidimicrobiia bacterium]|nr:alanine racemase [Acidimicrobiia bacterium]